MREKPADRTGYEGPLPFIPKAIHILFNLSFAQSKKQMMLYAMGWFKDWKNEGLTLLSFIINIFLA